MLEESSPTYRVVRPVSGVATDRPVRGPRISNNTSGRRISAVLDTSRRRSEPNDIILRHQRDPASLGANMLRD